MYVLFIELEPTQVDVNVHPTKQEIKFEDEKIIYAFVQAAVKHSLAQFSITPTLDFELDAGIQSLSSIQQPFTEEKKTSVSSSSIYKTFTHKHQAHFIERSELSGWPTKTEAPPQIEVEKKIELSHNYKPVQLHNQFIVCSTQSGFLVINQQTAHERIIYERLALALKGKPISAQRSLFPITFEVNPADAALMHELLPELKLLGYLVEHFGQNNFIIQGTPADIAQGNEKESIQDLIEQYKFFSSELKFSNREKLVRSVVKQQTIKPGIILSEKEMEKLISDLFACEQANLSPDGYPTYLEFKNEQLLKLFRS